MEEMMYFFVVVASAMFVINTIVAWLNRAQAVKNREINKAEHEARMETWQTARIERIEEKLKEFSKTSDNDLDF